MSSLDVAQVRAALALGDFDVEAAQRQMAPHLRPLQRSEKRPGKPRQASVLVLLFPTEAGLTLVLTRRSENEHDVHSGQISLPGGAHEADETPVQTALRETQEELGITASVQIIGSLSTLYIPPSDFEVHPFVGYVDARPAWQPDPAEVVEVMECPVAWLFDDERKVVEDWDLYGLQLRIPWYNVHGYRVWGATAIMLSEFEHRLRCVLD